MLDEVQIIDEGGVLSYFYSSHMSESDYDPLIYLKASFFTAINKFADELQNGEIRLIQMDQKKYHIKKQQDHLVIFGVPPDTTNYEGKLQEFSTKVSPYLTEDSKDIDIGKINDYLVDLKLIPKPKKLEMDRIKGQIESALFRSIGYVPGQCNIGRAERLNRLTFGLIFLVISFGLNLLIIELALPVELIFILIIPNFLSFLGILQYFYKFCTTNALGGKYTMR